MSFIPKPHEIYKHFKGNLYQIVAIAEHTETGEQLVVYQALYGDFKIYARPVNMFISRVDKEKYPEVTQEFRFELQGPDAERQKEAMTKAAAEQVSQTHAGVSTKQEGEPHTGVSAKQEGEPHTGVFTEQVSQPHAWGAAKQASQTQTELGKGTQQEAVEMVHATKKKDFAVTVEASKDTMTQESVPEQSGSLSDEAEELQLDPLVLEFLDAASYEQRLNILAGLHHRITDEMITTMAIACDIEINDGDIEERYESLKNCLLTLERYECNRLR